MSFVTIHHSFIHAFNITITLNLERSYLESILNFALTWYILKPNKSNWQDREVKLMPDCPNKQWPSQTYGFWCALHPARMPAQLSCWPGASAADWNKPQWRPDNTIVVVYVHPRDLGKRRYIVCGTVCCFSPLHLRWHSQQGCSVSQTGKRQLAVREEPMWASQHNRAGQSFICTGRTLNSSRRWKISRSISSLEADWDHI